jgi:hypothetical protein
VNGRQVVEALVATFNAGNADGMDDVFHEDAVMEWPQSGERIVGGDNRRGVATGRQRLGGEDDSQHGQHLPSQPKLHQQWIADALGENIADGQSRAA